MYIEEPTDVYLPKWDIIIKLLLGFSLLNLTYTDWGLCLHIYFKHIMSEGLQNSPICRHEIERMEAFSPWTQRGGLIGKNHLLPKMDGLSLIPTTDKKTDSAVSILALPQRNGRWRQGNQQGACGSAN